MMNIVSGALLGKKIPTLIYINSLFGFFLKLLYSITTAINWYVVFVLIVPLFISTTLFFRLFLYALKRHQWLAFALLGIFVFFFFKNFIFLQFTRSAYLLILSSALALMLPALQKEPIKPKALYWVGCLMGYAFLIRPMAALSGFVILLPLYLSLRSLLTIGDLVKIGLPFALIFVVGLSTNALTMSGPAWETYHQHNKARSAVLDTPRQNLIGKKKYTKKTGLSPTTLKAISRWYFPDDEVFSTALFLKISEKMPLDASPKKIKQTYHAFKNRHKKSGYQAYLYFWGLLLLLTLLFPKQLWHTALFFFATSVGSMHLFYHTMKISPRVAETLSLLSMLTVFAVLLLSDRRASLSHRRGFVFFNVAALCLFYFGTPHKSSAIQLVQKSGNRQLAAQNLNKSIKKLRALDPKGFFFPLSDNLRTKHQGIQLLYPNTSEYAQLNLISSGWTLHTPFYRAHLKANDLWPGLPKKMLNAHRYYLSPGSVMRIIKKVYRESYDLKIKEKRVHTFIQPISKNKVGVYRINIDKPKGP